MRLLLFPFRLLWRLITSLFSGLFAPFADLFDRLAHADTPGAFRDSKRRRTIPYKLYPPEGVDGPAPVVLFSHGLGGSTEAAPYLGRALAAAGFWGVFVQHPGSDRDLLEGASGREDVLRRRDQSFHPDNIRDRYLDTPFVLDRLAELNAKAGGEFEGRFDLARVGMAGHSYGARSVMAAAGQRLAGGRLSFKEPRVRAGVLLSPSGKRRPGSEDDALPASDFAGIDIPLLHITGTLDDNAGIAAQKTAMSGYRSRTAPFRLIPASEQYLLVLDGAKHADLGGTGRKETKTDSRYTRSVAMAATLFFDAYLRGSAGARQALREELPKQLATADQFEFR